MKDRFKDLSKETLLDLLITQIKRNEELWREMEILREDNKRVRKRIDELERQINRQAAPFRIEQTKRKVHPQSPGRKQGHAGDYRKIAPEAIDETVEVSLPYCPHCKGAMGRVEKKEQIIEDIPIGKKIAYKIITHTGKCQQCGLTSTSTHPLQTSQARGAAGVQLGPSAKALAMSLQFEYGMTKRKTCKLLEKLFQLHLSPGGLVYATHRTAQKMESDYQRLNDQLHESPVIHSDETSWYVGSPKYWLWVFTNKNSTVYRVSSSRGRDVITSAIGPNYQGALVSDCLSIYDEATPLQHKCYSHHLKAIRQAREKTEDPDQLAYLDQLRLLLKTAMVVKRIKQQHPPDNYRKLCQNLEIQADKLILPAQTGVSEKIANRLRKQRDHLFTFLYHDEVDATNNLAERQLRPAVISRKVSCGNKTEKGATTWQILASIAATSIQIGKDVKATVSQKFAESLLVV